MLPGNSVGNGAVNEQPGETQGPWPIESILVEICYPFSMGKWQSNIAQKKVAPCIISLSVETKNV